MSEKNGIQLSLSAYTKILCHVMQYPYTAVNGIIFIQLSQLVLYNLIAWINKPLKIKNILIKISSCFVDLSFLKEFIVLKVSCQNVII